jgi:hypothetical protein
MPAALVQQQLFSRLLLTILIVAHSTSGCDAVHAAKHARTADMILFPACFRAAFIINSYLQAPAAAG